MTALRGIAFEIIGVRWNWRGAELVDVAYDSLVGSLPGMRRLRIEELLSIFRVIVGSTRYRTPN
jgi:hypothetical protein